MPSVSNEVLQGARRHRIAAATELLAINYTPVYRMARGLCGSEKSAAAVLRFCMTCSLRIMRRWRTQDDPERWFYHHTVLASRRAAKNLPEVRHDLLVESAGNQDPAFLAFITCLRSLPFQQREAFILHHGEQLNPRYLSIAMDCSTTATETHLNAANATMEALGGASWVPLLDLFSRSYANLAPPPQDYTLVVRPYVTRHVLPRRVMRALRVFLLLAAGVALCYFVLHYRAQLRSLMPSATSSLHSNAPAAG